MLYDENGNYIDEKGRIHTNSGKIYGPDDSWYNTYLLDFYCSLREGKEPEFCRYSKGKPGLYCLENRCKYLSFSESPLTLSLTNEYGEVIDKVQYPNGIFQVQEKEKEDVFEFKKFLLKKLEKIRVALYK